MDIFKLTSGVLLIFFGRRLYWFFVGVVGFLAGTAVARYFSQDMSQNAQLAVAILFGITGLILAIFLQRVALAIAGGLAAAYFVGLILRQAVFPDSLELILVTIAFIVGAAISGVLFNWALILFSTSTGSFLVSSSLPLSQTVAVILFSVLLILGLAIQGRSFQRLPQK